MEDIIIKNNLKLARISKDLTQDQLAYLVGVTRQTIGLIEKGRYNPTLKLCLIIAKVLEKRLDELFWLEWRRNLICGKKTFLVMSVLNIFTIV